MQVSVDWLAGMRLAGTNAEGHRVEMDGPPALGGSGAGPRPMEMVLLGLGGCSVVDVVHILERGRRTVTSCRVAIDAERAETDPKVFTRIHMQFVVAAPGAAEAVIERAVALSAEKYCSVARMLASTADITHGVAVVDA